MKHDELEDAAVFAENGRLRRKPHDDGGEPSTAPEEPLKNGPPPRAQKRKVVAMGITLLGMGYLMALSSQVLSTTHHHYHHHHSSISSRGDDRSPLFGQGRGGKEEGVPPVTLPNQGQSEGARRGRLG